MKSPYENHTVNGYTWAYDEGGAHFFSKKNAKGYLLMRCLPEDMINGNFEYFAKHGLTNDNPVPKFDRMVGLLTAEQREAVTNFRRDHGLRWKTKLGGLWASGRDDQYKDGALLRQIRNEQGPEWLRRC